MSCTALSYTSILTTVKVIIPVKAMIVTTPTQEVKTEIRNLHDQYNVCINNYTMTVNTTGTHVFYHCNMFRLE